MRERKKGEIKNMKEKKMKRGDGDREREPESFLGLSQRLTTPLSLSLSVHLSPPPPFLCLSFPFFSFPLLSYVQHHPRQRRTPLIPDILPPWVSFHCPSDGGRNNKKRFVWWLVSWSHITMGGCSFHRAMVPAGVGGR